MRCQLYTLALCVHWRQGPRHRDTGSRGEGGRGSGHARSVARQRLRVSHALHLYASPSSHAGKHRCSICACDIWTLTALAADCGTLYNCMLASALPAARPACRAGQVLHGINGGEGKSHNGPGLASYSACACHMTSIALSQNSCHSSRDRQDQTALHPPCPHLPPLPLRLRRRRCPHACPRGAFAARPLDRYVSQAHKQPSFASPDTATPPADWSGFTEACGGGEARHVWCLVMLPWPD